MNYFFSIKNNYLKCNLTIPRFRNSESTNEDFILFSAEIFKDKWLIKEADHSKNENFFFLQDHQLDNSKFLFLAKNKDLNRNNYFSELKDFNTFTDTMPDFRANMQIEILDHGFSSYQSDYPFYLCKKTGNVLSPISTLLNKNSDKNIIFFKNIFVQPVKKKFNIYFVDVVCKKVLHEVSAFTNQTNEIDVNPELISPNVYIFSEKFVGIPIYVSIKNNHISMEHTHPLHLYIWGEDKFRKVSEIKSEIYEIIKKNSQQ